MNEELWKKYVAVLKKELIPAMGCTEPIAIALAAAKGKELLGVWPERVVVKVSGSILKNAKSVVVPNTEGIRGIPAAVIAGIVGGKAELGLQVLAEMTEEESSRIKNVLEQIPVAVEFLDRGHVFDIYAEFYSQASRAAVRITDYHTNFVYLEKDGNVLLDEQPEFAEDELKDRLEYMTIESICRFADEIELDKIAPVIERQMDYNWAIAEEGMRKKYGANIGKVLKNVYGSDCRNLACSMSAAGSDARMNGCELPVVVNSGSGNQGITVCIPVMVYGKYSGNYTKEQIIRALLVSNLTAIYEKAGIGTLSAYCGAVSAGAGAAAGIAYLQGEGCSGVSHTIVNALAISSGIICDGAKASCAGKIAVSVYTGILGYEMWKQEQEFVAGDGIVVKGLDANIRAIGDLATRGMGETNKEIIRQMIQ